MRLRGAYHDDPGTGVDIAPLCITEGYNPTEVSTWLRLEGLIKDDIVFENGTVQCAITMKGIARVDPSFVDSKVSQVLAGMGDVNSISNVMSILKLDTKDFQFAFDLAIEMQNRDLVKLLYAFQPGKVVNVEMTLEGVRKKAGH
jgi:hypothetical protein